MLAIVLPSVFGGLLCLLLLCVAVGIRERRRRQSKRETSVRMHRDSSDFAAHIMPFAADAAADADADADADAVKKEVPGGRAGSEGAYQYAKLDGRRPSSPTKAHSQTIALTLTLPLPPNPAPPP